MGALKIQRSEVVKVDVEIPASELVEKFSDEDLRAVGLYRDRTDAQIAQDKRARYLETVESDACDDPDCECPCHARVHHRVYGVVPQSAAGSEAAFWQGLRQIVLTQGLSDLIRVIEERAWEYGRVNLQLERALGESR